MRVPFSVAIDRTRQFGEIVVGGETRIIKVGEWSDWVPVTLPVEPLQSLRAQCRFYLRRVDPHFDLYVTPLDIDPAAPALPISTPRGFAAELARATGRYYTHGMPEETKALKAGVFSFAEFLRQARMVQDENRRQFSYELGRFDRGLLFYYFGDLDQVSHMLWRARDPQHPAYDAAIDGPYAHTIDDLYAEFDGIAGEALAALRPDDLLVIMSDHGFTSWRRSFNLNSWLRDEGYATRAYGLGLNGLYVNLKGREGAGVVEPAQRDALLNEISSRLLAVIDPVTGDHSIARVFRREQVYSAGQENVAPDLVVGYAAGTRVSDDSAVGIAAPLVFSDNRSAWSGDHCMDPAAVPGILLTSRPLRQPASSIQNLAASILAEFGVSGFPPR
jgi:predicted AlkP superfamily phosphohydrolase/phosphomutase